MYHIKIAAPGWETYTGFFGMVEFKDGVSVYPVPDLLADRVAAVIETVRIDPEGAESQAGIAARLVANAHLEAEVLTDLERQSEEEAAAEREIDRVEAARPTVARLYSVEELHAIADEKGIAGLREVAQPLGVRDRSIPGLIREIVRAQADARVRDTGEAMVREARSDADIVEVTG